MGYSLGLGPAAWVYSSEVGIHHRYCLQTCRPLTTCTARSFPRRSAPAVSTLPPRAVPSAASSSRRSGPSDWRTSAAASTSSLWPSTSSACRYVPLLARSFPLLSSSQTHRGRLVTCLGTGIGTDDAQVIWLLYPETKGRALEDMDSLFGKATDSQFHSSAYLQLDGAETGDEWAEDDAGREESPPGQEHEQRHARDSTEQEGEEDAPLLGR